MVGDIGIHAHIYIQINTSIHICKHTHICIHVFIHIYTYINTHTHICKTCKSLPSISFILEMPIFTHFYTQIFLFTFSKSSFLSSDTKCILSSANGGSSRESCWNRCLTWKELFSGRETPSQLHQAALPAGHWVTFVPAMVPGILCHLSSRSSVAHICIAAFLLPCSPQSSRMGAVVARSRHSVSLC